MASSCKCLVPTTGDLKNSAEKVLREIRRMKLQVEPDLEGWCLGLPSALMPIFHSALMHYSLPLAKYLIEQGYALYGKSDLKFMHGVYQVMRNEFKYQPKLTEAQFLSNSYAERKLMLTAEFLTHCQEKHNEIVNTDKRRRSTRRSFSAGPSISRRGTSVSRGYDAHPPEVFSIQEGRRGYSSVWSERIPVFVSDPHRENDGYTLPTYSTPECGTCHSPPPQLPQGLPLCHYPPPSPPPSPPNEPTSTSSHYARAASYSSPTSPRLCRPSLSRTQATSVPSPGNFHPSHNLVSSAHDDSVLLSPRHSSKTSPTYSSPPGWRFFRRSSRTPSPRRPSSRTSYTPPPPNKLFRRGSCSLPFSQSPPQSPQVSPSRATYLHEALQGNPDDAASTLRQESAKSPVKPGRKSPDVKDAMIKVLQDQVGQLKQMVETMSTRVVLVESELKTAKRHRRIPSPPSHCHRGEPEDPHSPRLTRSLSVTPTMNEGFPPHHLTTVPRNLSVGNRPTESRHESFAAMRHASTSPTAIQTALLSSTARSPSLSSKRFSRTGVVLGGKGDGEGITWRNTRSRSTSPADDYSRRLYRLKSSQSASPRQSPTDRHNVVVSAADDNTSRQGGYTKRLIRSLSASTATPTNTEETEGLIKTLQERAERTKRFLQSATSSGHTYKV